MTKKKPRKKGARSPDRFMTATFERMEACDDAEQLNDQVLIPFAAALEAVCEARGYLLNIYGEKTNIVFTNDQDAEAIYHLIENYLDRREAGDG